MKVGSGYEPGAVFEGAAGHPATAAWPISSVLADAQRSG